METICFFVCVCMCAKKTNVFHGGKPRAMCFGTFDDFTRALTWYKPCALVDLLTLRVRKPSALVYQLTLTVSLTWFEPCALVAKLICP